MTSRALRLRRDRPELFAGYRPLHGQRSGCRTPAGVRPRSRRGAGPGALTLATRLPYGLEQSGGWRDTAVELETAMKDELTGTSYGPGPAALSEVFRTYPVALLVPATGEKP